MAVNGPWRITFEFRDGDACLVDLEAIPLKGEQAIILRSNEYSVEPKNRTRPPVYPGVIFAEEIMPGLRGWRDRASVGVSRTTLYRLMAGEITMSPELAARIGQAGRQGRRALAAPASQVRRMGDYPAFG